MFSMSLLRYPLKVDERLTPSEQALHDFFFRADNAAQLLRAVHARVDAGISHAALIDAMHDIFTEGIGGSSRNISVATLRTDVVNRLLHKKNMSNRASALSRRVGFERSKIPTQILPRASFSLPSEDEAKGKVSFILM